MFFFVKNVNPPFVSAYEKQMRKGLSAAAEMYAILTYEKPALMFFARGNYEPEIIFSLSNIFARANDRAADTKALHKTVTRIFHGA